ncbi:MAG: glutaredoxin family protein [Endomicrobium sp.]|jgi:glutaredoxin-like protein NrdH|uniref:glutaredoxin family protein n=1 Tax=Candidatus Endomicrobiellum cubanum TaxID=3242325 RepID=UPI002836965F|nr:glutaredoxin family protein [Endomicrobium sp.]
MIKHVEGSNDKHSVFLYTLSTCVWCKKTKQFLLDKGIKYSYIDVDLLEGAQQNKVMSEISAVNPQGGFPTILIDKVKTIVGYQPEAIKEILQ